MNTWKIEVYTKPELLDTFDFGILEDIADLGITGVDAVLTATLYWIEGDLDAETIHRIATELLADPISQDYVLDTEEENDTTWGLEVQFKPGVTDAVGDSAVKGITDLGIAGVTTVRTGHKYWFDGTLTAEALETIAQRLLMNEVIQTYSYQAPDY